MMVPMRPAVDATFANTFPPLRVSHTAHQNTTMITAVMYGPELGSRVRPKTEAAADATKASWAGYHTTLWIHCIQIATNPSRGPRPSLTHW